MTKTRHTSDALGAKACPRDHYHKPLERDEVTLSAGYTAVFRRAVVDLILAPETKTYEDSLAAWESQEGCEGQTLPELIAPALVKKTIAKPLRRFPRSGPTPQNADGENIPDQEPLQSGPAEIPLVESPEVAADRLQRGAEDTQRKLTVGEQLVWDGLPDAEKRIAEATVARLHADLGHSSIRQMIGSLRMRKAHSSIVAAAKLYHCSACYESERRRLRPVTSGNIYAPGSHLAGDQFEWVHPTKDIRVLGTISLTTEVEQQ